jgi:hypothetical protein
MVDLAQRDPLQATNPTQAVLERRERLGGSLTGRAQVEHVGGPVVPVEGVGSRSVIVASEVAPGDEMIESAGERVRRGHTLSVVIGKPGDQGGVHVLR